jgi:hypothetical protein
MWEAPLKLRMRLLTKERLILGNRVPLWRWDLKTDKGDKELETLKRLLMLLLLKLGATPQELGLALNVNSSRISQIFPTRKISKIDLLR